MQRPAGHLKRWARTFAQGTPAGLSRLFAPWVGLPQHFGGGKRTRLFPPSVTFWLFLSQVLDEKGSCREALRRFQAWLSLERGKTASPNTAAYCKARAKLRPQELRRVNQRIVDRMETAFPWRWHGRRVQVVDGTGLSMPDTPENQAAWPQPKRAKKGCGFPVMRVAALFSLATGAMTGFAHGALAVHERTLYRKLWRLLKRGDVLLGDRGFCAFADFYLLSRNGVDCVMRKNGRRKNASVIRRNSKNDRIVEWKRSGARPKWLAPKTWRDLPESIAVREVEVHVQFPGFRSQVILVATTLLDHRVFPASDISDLYLKRWRVELFFRDLKTTMGMDILRCQAPPMVGNELWMHVIAYNLVRAVMSEAALAHAVPHDRISFKGTVSTLRQWAPALATRGPLRKQRLALYSWMLACIAKDTLPFRPGRNEPRARKRRPKAYQLLNKPRAQFREIMHRNRYKKP